MDQYFELRKIIIVKGLFLDTVHMLKLYLYEKSLIISKYFILFFYFLKTRSTANYREIVLLDRYFKIDLLSQRTNETFNIVFHSCKF